MQEWLTIQGEGLRGWRQSKGHVLGLAGVNFEAEGRTPLVEGVEADRGLSRQHNRIGATRERSLRGASSL